MDKLARLNSPLASTLDSLIQNNIRFLAIKQIENVAPERTYDIQVLKDHEFVANGIVSHNCLGKYHPHGDIAVYDSLVRLAQDFAMRYPLVDGQGNFGSLDGDAPAAQRYTECRLDPIATELLTDLDKNTVDWMDNYDASRKEPKVLPAKLPNLLLNGTLGIAVGMATDIPPHNLREIINATTALIDNSKLTSEDLVEHIQGPDFPTGGIIYDWNAIKAAYATGKGSVVVRAKTEIIENKDGSYQILITEIPYRVNKATLLEKFAQLVQEKKIEGIRNLRDESDKDGVRIVIDLKKDALPNKVLNQLFNYSQLQDTFHLNMLALVDGIDPRVLNLKMILEYYITHRREVVTRRTRFDWEKAKERAHILEGLKKALDQIDAVIKTIKQSETREIAHTSLQKKFKLSGLQATAILEMRLATLAGLERKKINDELTEKRKLIGELEDLLKSPKKIDGVIKKEIAEIADKFGDERRTKLAKTPIGEFKVEDLIANEEAIIVVTKSGYVKRLPPDTYRKQGRGGKGVIGITTKEEDVVEQLLSAETHDDILFFTNKGRLFQTKVYEIPESSRTAKGQALVNFLDLPPGEVATAVLTFGKAERAKYKFLFMGTKQGTVKKTSIEEFAKVRKSGLIALKIKKDDELRWVKLTSGEDEVLMTTANGQAIRYKEKDVRSMGRNASGVRGMRIKTGDRVMSLDIIEKHENPKNLQVLVVSQLGLGKKTNLSEYKVQNRGGSGIKTMNITKKTGQICIMHIVDRSQEADLVVISKLGQTLRTSLGQISTLGRATQGVRIMRLEAHDAVAGATIV